MRLVEFAALAGQDLGVSKWLTIDQDLIDRFAEMTGDDGFIHVDQARASAGQFGGTIAHGLLVLALAGGAGKEVLPEISDRTFLLNYGYEKIRMLAPVPTGSRVRTRYSVLGADMRTVDDALVRLKVTVECDRTERPALVAESLLLVVLQPDAERL